MVKLGWGSVAYSWILDSFLLRNAACHGQTFNRVEKRVVGLNWNSEMKVKTMSKNMLKSSVELMKTTKVKIICLSVWASILNLSSHVVHFHNENIYYGGLHFSLHQNTHTHTHTCTSAPVEFNTHTWKSLVSTWERTNTGLWNKQNNKLKCNTITWSKIN